LFGTLIGLVILYNRQSVSDWRLMYATAILPAVLVLIGRFFIPQSGQWLASRGEFAAAERETAWLLRRKPPYPSEVIIDPAHLPLKTPTDGMRELLKPKHRRAVIFAAVPWFLQDLGTYGIGIFTPTIIAATLGATNSHARNLADVFNNDILGAKSAALIDLLLIAGILFAVLLVDRVGRIRLQVVGFVGCATGLFLAALSAAFTGSSQIVLIFAGFMLFNFMTNIGPNAMTYLLAGEVFPTRIRGAGAGVAAAIGKVGAVLTSFLFPVLLQDIGTTLLLCILIATSLLGGWVTWKFRIETRGVNLESV